MSTEQDRDGLRNLVRSRMDFQDIRKRFDARLGVKADGTDQNINDGRTMRAEDAAVLQTASRVMREQEETLAARLEEACARFSIDPWLRSVGGLGPVIRGWIISEFDITIATNVSKMTMFAGLNPGMVPGKKRIKAKEYKPEMGTILAEYRDPDNEKKVTAYLVRTGTLVRGDRATPGFVRPYNKMLRVALCGLMADSMTKMGIRWEPISEERYQELPDGVRDRRDKTVDGVKTEDVPCELRINTTHPILNKCIRNYLDCKHRLENSERMVEVRRKKKTKKEAGRQNVRDPEEDQPKFVMWKDTSDAHRDRAAKRYMVKEFLKDLYVAWRTVEGLEVREPYVNAKLGHVHSSVDPDIVPDALPEEDDDEAEGADQE